MQFRVTFRVSLIIIIREESTKIENTQVNVTDLSIKVAIWIATVDVHIIPNDIRRMMRFYEPILKRYDIMMYINVIDILMKGQYAQNAFLFISADSKHNNGIIIIYTDAWIRFQIQFIACDLGP